MEILLAVVAYGAIVVSVVLFCKNIHDNCNQDCRQGRDCDCDDGSN